MRLLGPEHVTGLRRGAGAARGAAPRQRRRRAELLPVRRAGGARPAVAAHARGARTPAGPLRPWLVLVVVREQEGVSIGTYPATSLPVLRIDDPAVPAGELPDLAESWAWAHVQSLVAARRRRGGGRRARAGEVVARLVCPRRLLPDSAWLACVVPAFDGGVARGLGGPVAAGRDAGAGLDVAALRRPDRAARVPPLALHHRRGGRLRGPLPAPEARRRRRRPGPLPDGRRRPGPRARRRAGACCSTWRARSRRRRASRAPGTPAHQTDFQETDPRALLERASRGAAARRTTRDAGTPSSRRRCTARGPPA